MLSFSTCQWLSIRVILVSFAFFGLIQFGFVRSLVPLFLYFFFFQFSSSVLEPTLHPFIHPSIRRLYPLPIFFTWAEFRYVVASNISYKQFFVIVVVVFVVVYVVSVVICPFETFPIWFLVEYQKWKGAAETTTYKFLHIYMNLQRASCVVFKRKIQSQIWPIYLELKFFFFCCYQQFSDYLD